MRVARVPVDGDDGRVGGLEAGLGELAHDPLLHLVLVHGPRGGMTFADERERALHDPPAVLARPRVAFGGGLGPDGDAGLHEVRAADDVDAHGADQFDRAGVDDAHDRQGAARGVLHGDAGTALEAGAEPRVQVVPREEEVERRLDALELTVVDVVDQEPRLALGGHQQHHAAGGPAAAGEELREHGVVAPKVVEKPRVDAFGLHGGLDPGKVQHDG